MIESLLDKQAIAKRLRLLSKSRAELTTGMDGDQRVFLENLAQLVPPEAASLVVGDIVDFFNLRAEADLTQAAEYRKVNLQTTALEQRLAGTERLLGPLTYNQQELAGFVIEQLTELAETVRPNS